MAFEIEGAIHKIFETQSKSEKFQAREFVIKTEGTYPQFVKFQLTQDRCDLINGYNEGEQIKVYFDLRGREWNDKFFTNLNAWKVEKPATNPAPAGGEEFSDFPSSENTPNTMTADDFDDLPF